MFTQAVVTRPQASEEVPYGSLTALTAASLEARPSRKEVVVIIDDLERDKYTLREESGWERGGTRIDLCVRREEPLSAADTRSAADRVSRIRDVLGIKYSDLAEIFGVSRQSVHKWRMGMTEPEDANREKLVTLCNLADGFADSGVTDANHLLEVKVNGGRSLLDLLKAGEPTEGHVRALVAAESEAVKRRSRPSLPVPKGPMSWDRINAGSTFTSFE